MLSGDWEALAKALAEAGKMHVKDEIDTETAVQQKATTVEAIQNATHQLMETIRDESNKTIEAIQNGAEGVSEDTASEIARGSVEKHIKTLHKKLDKVNEQLAMLAEVKEQMAISTKEQRLQFAFANADFDSFRYFFDNTQTDTTYLVKKAVLCFLCDKGCRLPKNVWISPHQIKFRDEEFRGLFVEQVAALIGRQPRISLDLDDGFYYIYYE